MRYMTMVKSTEHFGPPPQTLMEGIMRLGMEATQAGVLVETGGLMPSASGARVRLTGGKITITDGPFTEAKELVGGYAVYDVRTKEEVIEWTRRFIQLHEEHWPGWEGEAEIRQIFDGSSMNPPPGQSSSGRA
jgi:hypothetical protein